MVYLLDADVLISAKNLHYGFDFCPAFWKWLLVAHRKGRVFSVEAVRKELLKQQDVLARWVRWLPRGFFKKPTATTNRALRRVAGWIQQHPRYSPAAKNTFLGTADYYLVAQALAGGHVVVTHERPQQSVHRVKIPDVCAGVGVRYLSPFDMLRREKVRFIYR